MLEKIEKKLKEINAGKVLDVGTGRGNFAASMAESFKDFSQIVGIDPNEKGVKMCKEQFKDKENFSFLVMNGENLDFPNEEFDTVMISNSIHHLKNKDKVFSEMKRVLKKDGFFIITEMFDSEDQTPAQKTHQFLHDFWVEIDTMLGVPHFKTLMRDEMKEIPEKLNFKEYEIYEYSFPVPNPKDEEFIKRHFNAVDYYLERVKDRDEYEALKEKSEKLKIRLKEIGFAPAKSVFIIGIK